MHTAQKWGNSLAVRIPAAIANQMHIKSGSRLDVRLVGDSLMIKPVDPHLVLEELLACITDDNQHGLVEWGEPVGGEAW